jgi:hypothetical protein
MRNKRHFLGPHPPFPARQAGLPAVALSRDRRNAAAMPIIIRESG